MIYLVFNEGYLASSGDSLTRHDLSGEAIRLGKLLVELLPEPEAVGLLALMLLHESRRPARTSASGELILLADQDRSLWNHAQIADAVRLVEAALASQRFGSYALQAAIAAVHAEAKSTQATDWAQIVGLYSVLMSIDPSSVVELNRAVAVAMRDGPGAGLALIDSILEQGELRDYHLAHAARADFCRLRACTNAGPAKILPSGFGPSPPTLRAALHWARLADRKMISWPLSIADPVRLLRKGEPENGLESLFTLPFGKMPQKEKPPDTPC